MSQHNSLTRDPVKMLLAGDYLNSSAYTVFLQANDPQFEKALEAIIGTSKSLIDSFNTTRTQPIDTYTYLDEIVGTLGEGATTVGAKLAGGNTTLTDEFANLGRALSSAHYAFNILELNEHKSVPSIEYLQYDESELCQYGARHFRGAIHALNELPDFVDIEPLLDLTEAYFEQNMGYYEWI
ncbi:hypothetical protein [Halorubrum tropicale]|uniref:hypothetical protein n=1 Tax=Halorubrum tropicale TaxID=1765655 RepID=UPI001111E1A9|nr:hypothetical protein [Halorubrum tropicale]